MDGRAAGVPGPILAAHLASLAQRGCTPGTIEARRRALHRMAAQIPVPLLEATAADLGAWRARLAVTGNTVVVYVSHAREFYRWAIAAGLAEPPGPAAGLPVPRLIRGLPRPAAEQDLMRAVATAPPRVRPWLVLAGWAGLRAREIALLRRERVLDTVVPPVLLVTADATKGHRERVVPLAPFALAALRAAGLPRAGFVFPRFDGRPGPNAPAVISHVANRHLADCGAQCTLHQLRHRFGSVLYQQTRDLRMVQELLGHADPASTAGYAAWDRSAAAGAVAALPSPVTGLRVVAAR
jgi:integrase/recombinase XerC